MAKLITSLTAEQTELLPAIRDEWLVHGLSCAPAERAAAEEGVAAAYTAAGLAPPPIRVWLGSPMSGAVGMVFLPEVLKHLRKVGGQVWDQVGDQVWDQVGMSLWGQHDAGYMSFFDAFDRLGLHDTTAPTRGLRQVAKSAGWWWALRGAVLLTERPTLLCRDPQGRLHSTSGPALLYPDGWGIWAVHGVRVPQRVVEHPEAITPEEILAEWNTEIRRVMIEQFGWDRFAGAAQLELLDEQPDPANPGHSLRLYDLPPRLLDFPVRLLVCTNASPERDGRRRQFGLTVEAGHTDAIAAAASTFGVDPAMYRQLERAT